ncbi:MAG TPA: methionine synthase, partial [Deltaproteobacteria bacterium]|nr:methionine synthase [Deltaproteobacteria bacterium]
SEMTDEALDWITGYVNQGLRRRAARLTEKRYSAGYGDFALENQKIIYDLLMMHELGVSITESYLLVPEKTVTALAGVLAPGL